MQHHRRLGLTLPAEPCRPSLVRKASVITGHQILPTDDQKHLREKCTKRTKKNTHRGRNSDWLPSGICPVMYWEHKSYNIAVCECVWREESEQQGLFLETQSGRRLCRMRGGLGLYKLLICTIITPKLCCKWYSLRPLLILGSWRDLSEQD